MRITRTVAVFTTALTATAMFAIASPGSAFAADSTTVGDVSAALDKVDAANGSLVADTAQSTTVSVSNDPAAGVQLSAKGQKLTIGIPGAQHSSKATATRKGAMVYPGSNASASAVIPTSDGVQFLTTIKNRKAPTAYDYPVTLPAGGKILLAQGGIGAIVLDATGQPIATVATPWAKDANGKDVPTRFTTDGKTLTQHVDHKTAGVAYPVVADPRWIERQWWGTVVHLTNGETRQIGQQAQWLLLALGWAPWGALFAVGAVGMWANGVADHGRCIAMVVGTPVAWEEGC